MTKSLAGLLGVAATASVATPVILLTGGESSNKLQNLTWKGVKIPSLSKSSDIRTNYEKVECLKKYTSRPWGDWGENLQIDANPSATFINNETENSKGCLLVEYYKQTSPTSKKWKGGFRFIWAFSNNLQELVIALNANTKNGKLVFDSSIYILGSDGGISYKRENSLKDITNNNELSSDFPKPKITNITGTDKYWGFDPQIDQICKDNECSDIRGKEVTPTSITWNLNKNNSSGSVVDWCENFDTWFTRLFSEWTKVKEQLKKLKGTWTKQS